MLNKKKLGKIPVFQIAIFAISAIILLLAFVPIILMFILSLKSNPQIYNDFFALPNPPMWSNYSVAINMLIPNMVNTLILVSTATLITIVLAVVSGYVFARMDFPLKSILFYLILALMMIPGILTLTPLYSLIQSYGLYNSWFALILPWVSGGQIFGILLCRTFMSGLPNEIFEAARIDGCSEVNALLKIAIPLSKPIIATIVVMKMVDYYNDFIWPLMAIESNSKQVITVAIRIFQAATGTIDIGSMVAGFVFATIPLLILFICTSRLYIEGLTSGAVKG